jgi:hypothetical protein
MCPVVSAPAPRLVVAQVPPCVPWCQLPPPDSGQLGCRHASCGTSSHLLAQDSSVAAMCPRAPAPASWLGVAWVSPCVPRHSADPRWNYYRNILPGRACIFQYATRQGCHRAPTRCATGDALNASKTCGQGCYRTATVQRRPAAHSRWIAIVQGG